MLRVVGVGAMLVLLLALLMAAAPDYDDFTDSGLGCVDCLDRDPDEPIPTEP